MMNKFVLLCALALLVFSCKKEKRLTANEIVNKSIEISGGEIISKSSINFNFRNIHYTAIRNSGDYKLGRDFIKNDDTIVDVLSNNGFKRVINTEAVKVADSMVSRYSASVNSVHYFSVLPYGLNDKAVNKTYLSKVEIKGKSYHKIKVTFIAEGGGEDFEDVFMYFINENTFKVEYLAYSYEENHGIGLRFREAYNERIINGVRFVDYNNYKPKTKNTSLDNIELLFVNKGLELLSKIELKHITVSN